MAEFLHIESASGAAAGICRLDGTRQEGARGGKPLGQIVTDPLVFFEMMISCGTGHGFASSGHWPLFLKVHTWKRGLERASGNVMGNRRPPICKCMCETGSCCRTVAIHSTNWLDRKGNGWARGSRGGGWKRGVSSGHCDFDICLDWWLCVQG